MNTCDDHRPLLLCWTDSGVEACLRELSFGYRARFLQQSARLILDTHSPDWLQQLRSAPYEEARDALRTLPGVGLKVSLLACLFGGAHRHLVLLDVFVTVMRVYKCVSTAVLCKCSTCVDWS